MSESPDNQQLSDSTAAAGSAAPPAPLLGIAFLALAVLVGYSVRSIPQTGLRANHDPGPAALPILLACLLAAGGLWEMLRWGLRRQRSLTAEATRVDPLSPATLPAGWLRVLLMSAGLTLYVGLLPILGFITATLIGCTVMMFSLGTQLRWAVTAALVLVTVVYGLFTELFRVQLPSGFWDRLF